jgi:hypothetical protein
MPHTVALSLSPLHHYSSSQLISTPITQLEPVPGSLCSGPELGEEAAEGEEAGPGHAAGSRLRRLGDGGRDALDVEHDGLADPPPEPLDGLHVHRLPGGVADVEDVGGLPAHRRHVGAGHRQPVLPEHPRHVRQQAHPVPAAQLQREALHPRRQRQKIFFFG